MLWTKPTRQRARARGGGALALACALAVAGVSPLTWAAPGDNQGLGDVAGDTNALVNSNVFNLTATGNTLTLVKRAFLADGTALTSGSVLPAGTTVKFLIYVNNDSTIGINDVSVQDVLDTGTFSYVASSIKVDNSQSCAAFACTALEEAAIFTAVDGAAALTDAVSGADVVSHVAGTIDAGNSTQANQQLDIAGSAVWAISFSVTMN